MRPDTGQSEPDCRSINKPNELMGEFPQHLIIVTLLSLKSSRVPANANMLSVGTDISVGTVPHSFAL
jgi:hypothetical protein